MYFDKCVESIVYLDFMYVMTFCDPVSLFGPT